ncbi:Bug family tripartite tricarboxylate transporter substrate binding protein [Falsiroseomonas oryzae]|uniref:Bug family tripartite tricarboxylate transporter substrate binding protein n=1 Tax=Falsiroseomonas oryzae TaxID=2766473 RepID=UPI0022EA3C4C|nr:tripartite tricarboxylate transporter substrate binding protein [Roseomonas sp. MO-31]
MPFRRLLAGLLLFLGLGTPLATAQAQSAWPNRPVRFVVPLPPGGASDLMARMIAAHLAEALGQPFVVDNRPGAGGTLGTAFVANAPPDGYTLMMGNTATHINAPLLFPNAGYDGLTDFAPVAPFATITNIVVVHPSLPVSSIPDLIAHARANPGRINFGSAGAGGTIHLAGELFKMRTGVDIVHVPYRGGAAMIADLVAGQVQLAFDNFPQIIPHVRSGAVRAIAVTSAQRWPLAPDLPTVQEAGVPDFDITAWFGTMAPARTPPAIVQRMNAILRRYAADPALAARLAELGAFPMSMDTMQFADFMQAERARYAEIIRVSGAKVD